MKDINKNMLLSEDRLDGLKKLDKSTSRDKSGKDPKIIVKALTILLAIMREIVTSLFTVLLTAGFLLVNIFVTVEIYNRLLSGFTGIWSDYLAFVILGLVFIYSQAQSIKVAEAVARS